MEYFETVEEKITEIKKIFQPIVGEKLVRHETAELFFEISDTTLKEDSGWDVWNDLPIRLYFSNNMNASVSWSKFENLFVKPDLSLPKWLDTKTKIRWVNTQIKKIDILYGQRLKGVKLGRGEMSVEDEKIVIWTRFLLVFETGYLEIFNALDENGYYVYNNLPEGEFQDCV